jgi:pimeloyl-ACP methyl ester carboxylesterase
MPSMKNNPSPLYFPSGNRMLFGWLATARGDAPSDVGVILCKPFGYEAICTHEALRAFTEACATAGAHSLRFDYTGTGDSTDCDDAGDEMSRWCGDIEAAIDALQRTCGVRRVFLVGIRLGALLAARVATVRRIAGLVAIAPVTNGRRHVRELLAFRAAAQLPGRAASPADSADWLEVTGFRLSTRAVDALRGIDLADGPPAQVGAALVIDRADHAEAKAWAQSLGSSGVDVTYARLPGYAEMATTPHAVVVPGEMIDVLRKWLARQAGGPAAGAALGPSLPDDAHMTLHSPSGIRLVERAMFIDDQRMLFAIVTEPAERASAAGSCVKGIILLNGGATVHIGPNRMYVDMGRHWAAKGYVVMRLDLAGLGDSESRPGEPRNLVYPPGAMDDIRIAIDFLRQRHGALDITVAGLCAGAYHAIRAAITGLPVNRALMINPLTFYWHQGDTLSDLQIAEVMRNPGVYMENIRSLRHWAKLLRGEVNLWRIVKVFVGRALLAIRSTLQELLRERGIRLSDDLGLDLASVARRGIPMAFYFARGDTGLDLLHHQAGSMVDRLGDLCRVHVIEGGDHIFSQYDARAELASLLDAELTA